MTWGQYKLEFSYDRDRVTNIKISPVEGDFKPIGAQKAAPAPAAQGKDAVVGTWHCMALASRIDAKADGSYDYNGRPGGRWTLEGHEVVFDGSLKPWGGGRAQLGKNVLEFKWKANDGAQQYFVFLR